MTNGHEQPADKIYTMNTDELDMSIGHLANLSEVAASADQLQQGVVLLRRRLVTGRLDSAGELLSEISAGYSALAAATNKLMFELMEFPPINELMAVERIVVTVIRWNESELLRLLAIGETQPAMVQLDALSSELQRASKVCQGAIGIIQRKM
jgi:hypothetical protein